MLLFLLLFLFQIKKEIKLIYYMNIHFLILFKSIRYLLLNNNLIFNLTKYIFLTKINKNGIIFLLYEIK